MYDYAPGICSGNRCYGTKTTLTVTGKVTDLEGDPLSGVSVVVQGTTRGTITNIDGAYSINVPSKQSVLVFSMISMKQSIIA